MSPERQAPTPPPVVPRHRFARRAERLEPIYASARFTLTWSFRLGAALLLVGILLAVIQRQPLDRISRGFAEVLPSVLRGEADGMVDLAILWLMLTPVVVVLIIAVGFFQLDERRYGLLSLLVLLVLGISITLALVR